MSRKGKGLVIGKGILSIPIKDEYIVKVTKNGIISLATRNRTNVKRPGQYKTVSK